MADAKTYGSAWIKSDMLLIDDRKGSGGMTYGPTQPGITCRVDPKSGRHWSPGKYEEQWEVYAPQTDAKLLTFVPQRQVLFAHRMSLAHQEPGANALVATSVGGLSVADAWTKICVRGVCITGSTAPGMPHPDVTIVEGGSMTLLNNGDSDIEFGESVYAVPPYMVNKNVHVVRDYANLHTDFLPYDNKHGQFYLMLMSEVDAQKYARAVVNNLLTHWKKEDKEEAKKREQKGVAADAPEDAPVAYSAASTSSSSSASLSSSSSAPVVAAAAAGPRFHPFTVEEDEYYYQSEKPSMKVELDKFLLCNFYLGKAFGQGRSQPGGSVHVEIMAT